jgi:hypothetical protein
MTGRASRAALVQGVQARRGGVRATLPSLADRYLVSLCAEPSSTPSLSCFLFDSGVYCRVVVLVLVLVALIVLVQVLTGVVTVSPGRRERPRN